MFFYQFPALLSLLHLHKLPILIRNAFSFRLIYNVQHTATAGKITGSFCEFIRNSLFYFPIPVSLYRLCACLHISYVSGYIISDGRVKHIGEMMKPQNICILHTPQTAASKTMLNSRHARNTGSLVLSTLQH